MFCPKNSWKHFNTVYHLVWQILYRFLDFDRFIVARLFTNIETCRWTSSAAAEIYVRRTPQKWSAKLQFGSVVQKPSGWSHTYLGISHTRSRSRTGRNKDIIWPKLVQWNQTVCGNLKKDTVILVILRNCWWAGEGGGNKSSDLVQLLEYFIDHIQCYIKPWLAVWFWNFNRWYYLWQI